MNTSADYGADDFETTYDDSTVTVATPVSAALTSDILDEALDVKPMNKITEEKSYKAQMGHFFGSHIGEVVLDTATLGGLQWYKGKFNPETLAIRAGTSALYTYAVRDALHNVSGNVIDMNQDNIIPELVDVGIKSGFTYGIANGINYMRGKPLTSIVDLAMNTAAMFGVDYLTKEVMGDM